MKERKEGNLGKERNEGREGRECREEREGLNFLMQMMLLSLMLTTSKSDSKPIF